MNMQTVYPLNEPLQLLPVHHTKTQVAIAEGLPAASVTDRDAYLTLVVNKRSGMLTFKDVSMLSRCFASEEF